MRRPFALACCLLLPLAAACDDGGDDFGTFRDCEIDRAVRAGQTVTGSLNRADCDLGDGTPADYYLLDLAEGASLAITMASEAFDPYLLVYDRADPDNPLDETDGAALDEEARLELDLREGVYILAANASFSDDAGRYTLRIEALP